MRIRNIEIVGKFDSAADPHKSGNRVNVNPVSIKWQWRPDGDMPWRDETLFLAEGRSWDGASRPDFVGWLVPRWGVFSLASVAHDECCGNRPFLSGGERISRKLTDLLYLELMRVLADQRVSGGWKAPAQIALAEVCYRAVRWLGEATWSRHNKEFSAGQPPR